MHAHALSLPIQILLALCLSVSKKIYAPGHRAYIARHAGWSPWASGFTGAQTKATVHVHVGIAVTPKGVLRLAMCNASATRKGL